MKNETSEITKARKESQSFILAFLLYIFTYFQALGETEAVAQIKTFAPKSGTGLVFNVVCFNHK